MDSLEGEVAKCYQDNLGFTHSGIYQRSTAYCLSDINMQKDIFLVYNPWSDMSHFHLPLQAVMYVTLYMSSTPFTTLPFYQRRSHTAVIWLPTVTVSTSIVCFIAVTLTTSFTSGAITASFFPGAFTTFSFRCLHHLFLFRCVHTHFSSPVSSAWFTAYIYSDTFPMSFCSLQTPTQPHHIDAHSLPLPRQSRTLSSPPIPVL